MAGVYESCGFIGIGKKEYDITSVCGKGTAFQDGKCVSIVNVDSDNASVCGKGTAFKDGKCVSIVDVASVCGPGTVVKDDKCIIHLGPPEEQISTRRMWAQNPITSKAVWTIDIKQRIDENKPIPSSYTAELHEIGGPNYKSYKKK